MSRAKSFINKFEEKLSPFGSSVIGATGKAVTELFNLDIKLSKGFTGNKKTDKPLKKLRAKIQKAMKELDTGDILNLLREMGENK